MEKQISIQQLIEKGKTGQAIQRLLAWSKKTGNKELHQEITLLSAQYHADCKAQRLGTSTLEEQTLAKARVNYALVQLIEKLPKASLSIPKVQKRYLPFTALALVIIVGIVVNSNLNSPSSKMQNQAILEDISKLNITAEIPRDTHITSYPLPERKLPPSKPNTAEQKVATKKAITQKDTTAPNHPENESSVSIKVENSPEATIIGTIKSERDVNINFK